ncbi:TniQ family protein [Brachybacterium vulturis]|uniref:TniQ family protein n=1 Tax=Brachybacterium vulturis TaxID=2017484 RepID=UPI0037368144
MPPRASTTPRSADPAPATDAGVLGRCPPPVRAGQLPLTVRPLAGEWTISWLTRTAHRFAITPRALLQATGVMRQTVSTAAAQRRALAPQRLHVLGLPGADATELGAPHPTADALRRNQTLYERPTRRIELPRLRYCPACLASDVPAWPKAWNLTTTMVCIEHHLVLVDACPGCGRRPFSRADWLATTAAIYRCPHALPDDEERSGRRVRRRCRTDLRTASASRASRETVAAQRLFDATAAADPRALTPACGTHVEETILFGAILDLTDALQAQGIPSPAARSRAIAALQELSPSAAASVLGSLERVPMARGVPNPLAEALRLETFRHQLSPTRQLELRAARTFLALPMRDGHRQRQAHALPEHRTSRPTLNQLRNAPLPTISDRDGAPLPPDVVRLLLARVGRPATWAHLAKDLDLPSDLVFSLSPTLRALQRSGTWATRLDELELALQQLAGRCNLTTSQHTGSRSRPKVPAPSTPTVHSPEVQRGQERDDGSADA